MRTREQVEAAVQADFEQWVRTLDPNRVVGVRAKKVQSLLAALGVAEAALADVPSAIWQQCEERAPHTSDPEAFLEVSAWVVCAIASSVAK